MKIYSKYCLVSTFFMGKTEFQLIKDNKPLSISGTDKFVNAYVINEDLFAVAVEDKSHKTIKIRWFAVDSNGIIKMSCKSKNEVDNFAKSLQEAIAYI